MTENKSMIKKGQARITHNEESVNALGERVDKSTQLVTNNHEAIHKIQGNEQHNSQLIVSNTQGVKANTQHVSENKEAIHLQQSIALKDEQLMSANSHAIKQEQRDITTNSDAIARNQTEIKGLRKDMENMAKNIDGAYAESAAFAGLVDPYGVGNIAVTAALGYHGDAEAVAVGIGERFNENLTAKLGGAYDTATDSMSAYAGIGYEF
ncbi:YadA C-terminal domain-containing protein [Aliivibrio wodanis]|uniref:YadA C-terminal domain-containing protein n=1 Tax=Aliivibrio wodanis TaxID=80852 RepID=UPI00406CDF62